MTRLMLLLNSEGANADEKGSFMETRNWWAVKGTRRTKTVKLDVIETGETKQIDTMQIKDDQEEELADSL